MRIRDGGDADATAATAVVRQVLHEHGLPFDPRGLDADILAPGAHYQGSGGLRLAPERDRTPSRPAGARRRPALVPWFA